MNFRPYCLFRVVSGLCDELIIHVEESYRVCVCVWVCACVFLIVCDVETSAMGRLWTENYAVGHSKKIVCTLVYNKQVAWQIRGTRN